LIEIINDSYTRIKIIRVSSADAMECLIPYKSLLMMRTFLRSFVINHLFESITIKKEKENEDF
jgi:hypothetical protein